MQTERLIRLRTAMDKTGLSKTSIYRLSKEGKFPAGVQLSAFSIAWRESEVDDWIASRKVVTGPLKRPSKATA